MEDKVHVSQQGSAQDDLRDILQEALCVAAQHGSFTECPVEETSVGAGTLKFQDSPRRLLNLSGSNFLGLNGVIFLSPSYS